MEHDGPKGEDILKDGAPAGPWPAADLPVVDGPMPVTTNGYRPSNEQRSDSGQEPKAPVPPMR